MKDLIEARRPICRPTKQEALPMTHDKRVAAVARLLEDRLDFWLPGGEGLREALPDLAREIAALTDERD
jgi:hypothetical protein